MPILRPPANQAGARRGIRRQYRQEKDYQPDERNGIKRHLSAAKAEFKRSGQATQEISVSVKGPADNQAESSLGNGHHLHKIEKIFCLSRCHFRLVLALCHRLEAVANAGKYFLHSSAR